MKPEPPADFVEALGVHLRAEMQRSEPFRNLITALGQWLIEQARADEEQSSLRERATAAPAPEESRSAVIVREPTPRRASTSAGIVPLRLGDAELNLPVTGTTEEIGRARASADNDTAAPSYVDAVLEAGARVDLALVEKRCRLKAESCLLFIERRAAMGDPVREPELIQRVNEIIARAKSMRDCFLWVLWRDRSQPDDASLTRIAACYTALADAASLVHFCDGNADAATAADNLEALQTLAEANSAMRIALESTWLSSPDMDQDEVHKWLRRETAVRRILIPRHMRLDDPADPASAPVVSERTKAVRARIEQRLGARKSIQSLIAQVRYHAKNLQRNAELYSEHDCRKVAEALERLSALGVEPDDRRVTQHLAAIDPDRFLAEVDSAEAIRAWFEELAPEEEDDSGEDEPDLGRAWSDRVAQVRTRLQGTTVVVVGGERRQSAVDRIREAFGLADVEWVRLSEHGSGEGMRAPIGRPETSLVLVLVKLAGHLHVDEARFYAQKSGKPCVLLTAGYNPEQIAFAVIQQSPDSLEAARA